MSDVWTGWGLLERCSHFIGNNLPWGRTFFAPGAEKHLSNDQKFMAYEIKKASVSAKLGSAIPELLEGHAEGFVHLRRLLQLLDDRINDEILKAYPIDDGEFKKLQLLARLLDDKEAKLLRFLKPIDDNSTDATEQATRFNKFIERLLAPEPVVPPFKQQHRGGSKLGLASELSSQLQRLSLCLFETLVDHSLYCEERQHNHIAKLHLTSPRAQGNDDEQATFSFDTFLCSCSDREPQTWHEITFNFNFDLPNDQVPYPQEHVRLYKLLNHCEQRKQGLRIDCIDSGNEKSIKITNLQFHKSPSYPALPDISLASLIGSRGLHGISKGGEFTPGDKAALLLTLAVSLLHLSSEGWLRNRWRAEDIYFLEFQDISGVWVKDIGHPYLSARLSSEALPQIEADDLGLSNPSILSLALVMVEIQAGRRIEVQSSLWSTINDVIDGEMQRYFTRDFKEAIVACLNFELQVHLGVGETIGEKTRDIIFRKIVGPLEKDLERWEPPVDGRRELKLGRKPSSQVFKAQTRRQSTKVKDPVSAPAGPLGHKIIGSDFDELESESSSGHSSDKAAVKLRYVRFQDKFEDIQNEVSSDSERSEESFVATLYDEWDLPSDKRTENLAQAFFKEVTRFNRKFINGLALNDPDSLPSWQQRPVRVAILDSGLKVSDPFISGAVAKHRIVGQRSWVDTGMDDTYGHGTHVACLFLKMAPHAQLYIAKISDTKEIPESQLPVIGEAIEHAIKQWDVDIISMSLGLDDLENTIDQALEAALKPDKNKDPRLAERIVFAAASNGGASKARAYPANKSGVICVNASDGNGGSIRHLSPAAVPGEDNFVTLGIHVELRWKRETVFKSGTSFATPIAAALAANILEFARYEVHMKYAEKCWLYSFKGMRAVLRRFSAEVEGYRFLCPWRKPEGRKLDSEFLRGQLREAFKVDYFK